MWESPITQHADLGKSTLFRNVFNATMSYRLDSEFWLPYGSMVRLKIQSYLERYGKESLVDMNDSKLDEHWKAINSEKKSSPERGVVSIISNCNGSGYRKSLVEELGKLLKLDNGTHALDTFGKCQLKLTQSSKFQKNKSPLLDCQNADKWNCVKNLSKNYKFILSIENSRCKDYITEKFFSNALLAGSVPIVAGAKRAVYEKLAPGSSFIHVDDFESVQDLADRVNYLIGSGEENEKEYAKYHEWRKIEFDDEIKLTNLEEFNSVGVCGMCNVLWNFKNSGGKLDGYKALPSVRNWWYARENDHQVCESNAAVDFSINKEF